MRCADDSFGRQISSCELVIVGVVENAKEEQLQINSRKTHVMIKYM